MAFRIEGDVEAFGQTEALTKRIGHILEQYPDGPNIVSELIQNADDAGASRVCVLYNSCTYGTASLLSPAMAKWQGPALYCYNNAEFSDSDFINLARIGQANKLQRAATTGRFGLGFNSVYHFTDLPSIVSANSIVMFDPHASHLPGISAANPGIKIRFANSSIVNQYPDQFAPFKGVFGCDLTQRFNGTLFRFPLRNRALAEASEIKRRAYSQREIADLFESFHGSITETMLFLRNVRQVEVYVQSELSQPPVLLYDAEVPAEDRGESWRKIDRFMRGEGSSGGTPATTELSAKRAFYTRLQSTPEHELPSVTQVLHVRRSEQKGLQESFQRLREETQSVASLAVSSGEIEAEGTVETYLVCNRLGGGKAREMACAPENESLKLIPWVGIAGRIDGVAMEGRAFCFLPLPVRVGLPVHINGYFELSSNRRDIWHGDDMTGDGKLRSEWNASVLKDAVAPAYLTFLLEVKRVCGDDTSKYMSFFPAKLPVNPWSSVVYELFRIMKDQPVFISSSPQSGVPMESASRSVTPSSCVVVDDTISDWETLRSALSKASLTTVHLPVSLRELLIQLEAVYGAMTPEFFRKLTRGGQFLPVLEQETLRRVVQFCISDCQGSSASTAFQSLDLLPLLPLRDGSFGLFRVIERKRPSDGAVNSRSTHQAYFLGNAMEEELLEEFPHRVVRGEYKALFDQLPSVYECSNLRAVDLGTILESFLPHILGRQWKKSRGDVFSMEASQTGGSLSTRSNSEWIRLLWAYVETQLSSTDQLPQDLTKWPLVPIIWDEEEPGWVNLSANVSLVIPHAQTASVPLKLLGPVQQTLTKLGIHVVDTSYLCGEKSIQWMLSHKYAHKLTSDGLLAALSRYQFLHERRSFDDIFAGATAADKQALCDFLSTNGFDAVATDLQPILFELPIFRVHETRTPTKMRVQDGSPTPEAAQYVSLRRGGYLPNADADTRILDDSFFHVQTDEARRFLRDCGVEEWTYTNILLHHVFPQLPALEAQDAALVDAIVVDALVTLPFHQRNDARFREVILTHRIIPSRKRVLRTVSELHDPSISELSDLVGENSLPAEAFSTPEMVEILRSLGLRTGLSCHAVLESARFVETIYGEDGEDSVERACMKAHSLLAIVNKHFDSMMASARSAADASGREGDSGNVQVMQDIMADLNEVQWLPIRLQPLDPAMPWKVLPGSGGRQPRLSRATNMRPQKDAWFCSCAMNILDGELTSKELIAAFGWGGQVSPFVVGKQLEAIGSRWEHHRREQDAGGERSSSSTAGAWRFPLAEVHQMYEELESHRLSDEEHWETSAVYRKLANGLWIWTGKGFAYPRQIAVEADANLEPLLYCCPSEHIIPRSLLASFGLKDAFTTVDYLTAVLKLPRNVVLQEKQITACLKIYDLIGEDTSSLETALDSFVSEEMVLLDQTNRLIPTSQLTFDDMEWNESKEVRRGVTFVSKKTPKTVAAALGAASLHSKLAQTSVTTRRVVCPPVNGLESVIPARSEWHHTFLWETILAAERFGGSQVDFFVDYRHHPAQRVIQPSFQPLQNEALCIHIHNVVLSESDINTLFHGAASRSGLLCGFFASDCMQIVSGDGFYVLDPIGCYLTSAQGAAGSTASAGSKNIGRRYEVTSQDFVRYPDQLLPFTTLPSCPSNVSRGTQSTLIRFPWRKTGSAVSPYVLDEKRATSLIAYMKSQLYHALVFTESVHHISLWSVGKESEFASHCHGEASLDAPERTLQKRNMTRQNTEWKKKFSLRSIFKSPVIPENQMEFTVNLELENRQHRDVWLAADNVGVGRGRDLACSAVHQMLHSTPYVSVACHLLRDGNPAPRLKGQVFKIVSTHQQVGLPVHINGCFKKTMKETQLVLSAPSNLMGGSEATSGSEQQISAGWNRILLEDGVADAYVKLLLMAKRRYENSTPKAVYHIWPALQKGYEKELGALIQTHTYRRLGTQELFLCTDGNFRPLSGGYLMELGAMDIQVASFAQLHFPAFSIPSRILADCLRLVPSRVHTLTPKSMRRFLRNMGSAEVHPDVCLSLLEYCLSDVPFPLPSETDSLWTEFHGLSLLPLEDGSIGVLRVNQRRTSYMLGSFNQIQLLPALGHVFVSVAARIRLHKYFSDPRFTAVLGLASFSIKTLSDNIERVLPAFWKHEKIVDWNPDSPLEVDQLWLYRFWQEVRFERRSLGYFANWPLIPVKGSRLVSCREMDMAVCVWNDSVDNELTTQVVEAFQASNTQQEARMAEMEVERKRLMELSATKFQKGRADEDGSFDDDESEKDDDDEGDGDGNVGSDEEGSEQDEAANVMTRVVMEDLPSSPTSHAAAQDDFSANPTTHLVEELPADGLLVLDADADNEEAGSDVRAFILGDGPAVALSAVRDENADVSGREFCSREMLYKVLSDIGVTMLELAYLTGQERDIVARSPDVALAALDGIFASKWSELRWNGLSEERAMLLAEFFSHNGDAHGGYNRVQLDKLKQLPIFVNIGDVAGSIHGGREFFLIPPDLNLDEIPLPPNARQCFLKSNPRLTTFYKELGVEELSDTKLMIYVLPMYGELEKAQRDQFLQILLRKWQSLRGNAELTTLLRTVALFLDEEGDGHGVYHPASAYCDPRNHVLATIFNGIRGQFPAQRFQSPEWLDLMGEIGLRTEVTVEIFVECAQRIDGQCSGKQALTSQDEHLVTTLHQFFVQNFEKFDRSRAFFESITPLAFVPAIVYETTSVVDAPSSRQAGLLTSRTVVRRYAECATPDDQALVYSTMPILGSAALPPRVLWSRLGITSPPAQHHVVAHLLSITNGDRPLSSRSLDWQFFLPMVDVFQTIFKYLQDHWDRLDRGSQRKLTTAAVIPVGSTLVKGSHLFFHLGENLAPLMFEVPRAFGAYDTLFRHMGSKDEPEVTDYLRLLRDLHEECRGHALNLNELIAAARAVELLADALAESNHRLSLQEKRHIFLPSGAAVMQSMLVMAYNDSAALCANIDLTELHVVHPRMSTRCCQILGVPGISSVVSEELESGDSPVEPPAVSSNDEIAHFGSMLASSQFADGLRKIITAQQQKAMSYDPFGYVPDFEDLNQRIASLGTYEIKCVATLQSRFMAKLEFPTRKVDVTKAAARQGSLSFLDQPRRCIYIAKHTLEARSEMGMRASLLVVRCINQLLGGVLEDCSALESILTCDVLEIPAVLQLLDIYEDPVLIVEKLRGLLGEPLSETDRAGVELAPLRSCLPGELVAVEGEGGELYYGKVLREQPSKVAGVSHYEVKVSKSATRWLLATQLYFFRSAWVGSSSRDATTSAPMMIKDLVDPHSQETSISLPASVVAIAPEASSAEVAAPAVPSANVLSAVNDLLSRLNVSLDTSVEELLADNLRLQHRLELAEAGRRAASAQIDAAIREKKDAQDSLVCAVCLENKVDRVLIPCGHIYCSACVRRLPRPSCPICRQNIVSSSAFHVPS